MNRNAKISVALVALFALVVGAIALLGGDDEPPAASTAATEQSAPPAATPPVVRRSDARVLGKPGRSGVVFTEFLDFECESCRAAFPLVEELRREYAGRVTFAIRYFPLGAHRNAENAAIAVEAAAQQGALERMYARMYETQTEWGEQMTSKAHVFRGFARDLGLDMREYDAAVADPATRRRVLEDRDAGLALGVQGTPTFFLDDQPLQPQTTEDLIRALDAAIAKT